MEESFLPRAFSGSWKMVCPLITFQEIGSIASPLLSPFLMIWPLDRS
ncbi:hypothetical protein LINGRAPRIM_LOCUS2538 [Linum grandiflorum]